MKKIFKAYRIICLSLLACLAVAEAKGQAVVGDKYITSIKGNVITPNNYNTDGGNSSRLAYLFDGNGANTYWIADNVGTNGILTITLDFGENHNPISLLSVIGGGYESERPNSITIYQSNNSNSFTDVVHSTGTMDRSIRYYDIELQKDITMRYVRLSMETGERILAFNEIDFYEASATLSIKHKPAKWFDLRKSVPKYVKDRDRFNDDVQMIDVAETSKLIPNYPQIQAAHTMIDTIYMHRGTSITLDLPDALSGDLSVQSYQRWYSFRRDGTFEVNDHSDGVYDLLTPASGTLYRFQNGYVGSPLTAASNAKSMNFYLPTVEEFERWFNDDALGKGDWFVVACDVSGYTDFTETFSQTESQNSDFLTEDGGPWEPTLMHRVLFFISAVERSADSPEVWYAPLVNQTEFQGGGNAGKKYLEEKEINFPFTRLNTMTGNYYSDAVALSNDARSYIIPNVNDGDNLDVQLTDNTAGITLRTTSISGSVRNIQFDYPNTDAARGIMTVNEPADGSEPSAVILVTKTVNGTVYNIARFQLKFPRGGAALTQSLIEKIDGATADDFWMNYKKRTPAYMAENYQLITSLTWDYYDAEDLKDYGNQNYYHFPMDWEYSSYGFYDGSTGADYKPQASVNGVYFPEWGHYAITKDYVEFAANWGNAVEPTHPVESNTYHMYVDASDRPGTIAMVPFRDKFCSGTEMFISAWVKDAGYSQTSPGMGLLFTIVGVDSVTVTDTEGKEYKEGVSTPLYRYSTGQIKRTDYLSNLIPGCGSGHNEWMQVYFSFVNDGNVDYDSYVLYIENASISTAGGDLYLDDIRVYVSQPAVAVSQLVATCTGEATRMNMTVDWNQLISRTGGKGTENDPTVGCIDFCFIDQIKFYAALEETEQTEDDIRAALEASVVKTGQGEYERQFSQLHYYLDYNSNLDYNASFNLGSGDNAGPLAINNLIDVVGSSAKRGAFYKRTVEGRDDPYLSVDFYSTLSANRPYWMLVNLTTNSSSLPTVEDFLDCLSDCAIKTEFYLTSTNQVRIEGELMDPTLNEYCGGQVLSFSVDMRYPTGTDENGVMQYEIIDETVYYDWFFDTEEVFLAVDETYGVSPYESLDKFRDIYPDATTLEDCTPQGKFTQSMYDLLKKYSEEHMSTEVLNPKLTLYQSSLDIRLLSPGLNLVVNPIEKQLETEENDIVCWTYIPLSLRVTDNAPVIRAGFTLVNYPELIEPNLRIGLEQIKKVSNLAEDGTGKQLFCNLRTPTFATANATSLGCVELDSHDSQNRIYLMETNDPDVTLHTGEGATRYDYPVGWLDDFQATEESVDNYMKFRFDLKGELSDGKFIFNPREGYYYKIAVYYEEKMGDEAIGNACYGSLHFDMLVVPEYVEWNGARYDNWNNDDNWLRVNSAERLNKAEGTYDVYTENAFVPMQFSKVILPRDSKVELYVAGYNNGSTWNADGRPDYMGARTENIEYDLMVVDNAADDVTNPDGIRAERYRAYWVDQIHFEPGAEMLRAELLIYEKAWVDYELEKGKWYTLTSPLKGVVAGDFYTDQPVNGTATEGHEFFQPITFDPVANNRLKPAVYQRPWDAANAELTKMNASTSTVAISANWGGVYNDVDAADAYRPTHGFSMKVTGAKALFRLPKDDSSYSYYNVDGSLATAVPSKDVSKYKTEAGKLVSDSLYLRVKEHIESSKDEDIVRVLTSNVQDGKYYLVGNPFMTKLDVKKFFAANANLEPKYWLGDGIPSAAAETSAGEWVSTDSEATEDIPPLRSFFVEKKEEGGNTITISADMQAEFYDPDAGNTGNVNVLHISAFTDDGRESRAAVAFSPDASSDYVKAEDAELFMDSNFGDLPLVYTVGGNHALSVNQTPACSRIPLNVYGQNDENVVVRFDQGNALEGLQLYDALFDTTIALADGHELSMSTNDDGRYYLQFGEQTGVQEVEEKATVFIWSVRGGEVVVTSSGVSLASIQIYTVDGVLVTEEQIREEGNAVRRLSVRGNENYVVVAKDTEGRTTTAKLHVRK